MERFPSAQVSVATLSDNENVPQPPFDRLRHLFFVSGLYACYDIVLIHTIQHMSTVLADYRSEQSIHFGARCLDDNEYTARLCP